MTDQTTGKVAKLTPEEWKQLVVLNAVQLQNYLQSIPGHTESGGSGLSEQNIAIIEVHQARGRAFMRAWQLATNDVVPAQPEQPTAAQGNGATPPAPKKGGWPKGKRRTSKQPEAA